MRYAHDDVRMRRYLDDAHTRYGPRRQDVLQQFSAPKSYFIMTYAATQVDIRMRTNGNCGKRKRNEAMHNKAPMSYTYIIIAYRRRIDVLYAQTAVTHTHTHTHTQTPRRNSPAEVVFGGGGGVCVYRSARRHGTTDERPRVCAVYSCCVSPYYRSKPSAAERDRESVHIIIIIIIRKVTHCCRRVSIRIHIHTHTYTYCFVRCIIFRAPSWLCGSQSKDGDSAAVLVRRLQFAFIYL